MPLLLSQPMMPVGGLNHAATIFKKCSKDSVDDYLEFCAQRGESPAKTYSGRFVVRVEPELHKQVTLEARKSGKSLNVWINDALSKALKNNPRQGRPLTQR